MQIITRAMSIVDEVASRPDGVGLAEIAAATSLPTATCHRLLAALHEDNLVERHPISKRYRVGPALVRLSAVVSSVGAGPLIEQGMADLRDRWQECFFLAAVVGDSIMSVRSIKTVDPNRMSVSVPLGRRMYPHAAASCKAILAYLPPERRKVFIDAAGGMVPLTAATITDPAQLDRELEEVRRTGFGACDQESEVGVAALAVPILTPNAEVNTSLAVIGPRDRLLSGQEQGLIAGMTETAQRFANLQDDSETLVGSEYID